MTTPRPLKVLYHLHPNLDTLDLCGPLELLSHAHFPSTSSPQKAFLPTLTAVSDLITTDQGLKIHPDIPISTAYTTLSSYDILIIPGGGSPGVLEGKTEPLELIKAFFSLPKKERKDDDPLKGERILMSVCTGSLFLAAAGVLDGLAGTTHPYYYGKFREILNGRGKVLEERFVVNGTGEEGGVRVVTCGGVSCGMDGSLWLIERVVGREAKEKVMEIVQYNGRDGEGVIV
ncbi:class I glutamine amidotransferase-like protein [Mollisia scopiformis]|uniref:Class I glutamine amidotransferase-like protein n=1 Tax=Mollisia scopiformis TaxID=149040 RepID=A0A132BA63_MOLSC|nr:class I glutamine amidotransferase-like protein [Mollisia scopiformis]KUJ09296.1 class I glutamine amidotransferase-like protein [Mollisia scopiformis]